MTNKPMLSVERELLEAIHSHPDCPVEFIDHLRRAINHPAENSFKRCTILKECNTRTSATTEAAHPAPVAVVIDEDQSFAMWMHEAVEFTHSGGKVSKIQRREIVELSEERWALDAWKGRARLAGKSAPVAVEHTMRSVMEITQEASQFYVPGTSNWCGHIATKLNRVKP